MKTYVCIFVSLVSALAAQAGVSTSAAPPAARPVARVNGTVLTDRDLVREMYAIFPYAGQHGGFPKGMEADIRKGALQMIVFEELAYQEALRRKLPVTQAAIDHAMAGYRNKFPTPEQYQEFLKVELNGSQELLRNAVKRNLLIDEMLRIEVTEKAAVSNADAKAFYAKNPDRFRTPDSFALQTISLIPAANATPVQMADLRKRAEAALKQAKATKTYDQFGALAEKTSEDDYRVMMGDHKAVDRSKLPPPILSALANMHDGEVSGLVQVDQVYTIIRLNGHLPAGMQKFEAVKDTLRKELEKTKTEQLRSALDKRLRLRSKVETL